MKISIITATYNSEATVKDTIECISRQTYKDIEHVIVDGNSSDRTMEIVEHYGDHIAKVVSEPDNGIYDAMNKGINLTTGDIIGILNSDDFYINNEVIEKVIQAFENEEVDSVYGDLQYVHPKEPWRVVRSWRAGNFRRNRFLYGWMLPHPTFFVRRSVYEEFGRFNLSLSSAADYEIMLRFLYKNKISTYYIPEVLVRMRTGGVSNASLKNRLVANWEDRMAWRLNDLQPRFYTTLLKPIRKIGQFVS
ncbi:MAG: glycosyltransferase [Phaeodactylibacter sp.]|nr:glycosyltransferase [Phaeodactylibacter sp.]